MRTILHSDCNNFYATVETVFDPKLRGKPLVVCGDPGLRHGIVLAKSYAARRCGIITGETVWQAQRKCPDLILVGADQRKYLSFSKKMRAICRQYTSRVEPFGLDENWLDVTGHRLGGEEIAARIRRAAREELGITVSIGISYNKVFAKLGSDMRRPDATTVISPNNYQQKAWPLPVSNLLYVGPSAQAHLAQLGLYTIGDIATCSDAIICRAFGKNGQTMQRYARGEDDAPVLSAEEADEIKSIGNSTTTPRDIACDEDAKAVLYLLSDSVATRLRAHRFACRTVSVWMRDVALNSFERQCRLPMASNISGEIAQAALSLMRKHYSWTLPLRSLGVRGSDLQPTTDSGQMSLLSEPGHRKHAAVEQALDGIRSRYGHASIQRGLMLSRRDLTNVNPVDDHALQPLAAMRGRD